ncbi:MAG: hypothetical protein K2Q28_09100 [Hyphomicrobium sp.]|nr:hypothetical protein [Hyphomicrobium sp.]
MGDAGRHRTTLAAGLAADGPAGDGLGTDGPGTPVATTRMAYMADLLLELQDMAAKEGHATLAGLLSLAHSEALNKIR